MASSRKVDVNTATVEELESLVGVGHAKALSILETRKVYGGFGSVSDLMKVPRIGPSIIEQNRCVLVCSSPTSPGSRHTPNKCQRETRSSAKAELDFMTSDPSPEEDEDEADADGEENEGGGENELLLSNDTKVKSPRTRAGGSQKDKSKSVSVSAADVNAENDSAPSTSKCSMKCEHSSSSAKLLPCRLCVEPSSAELPSTSGANHGSHDNQSKAKTDDDTHCEDASSSNDSDSEGSSHEEGESGEESMEEAQVEGRDARKLEEKVKMEVEMSDCSPTFTIRSRIPVRIFSDPTKSWMKRKSDCGLDMRGHSPGKKPCRGSERVSSLDTECSLDALRSKELETSCDALPNKEPETSYDALRSKTNIRTMQRHRRIPSKSNPPPELADWLKTFQSWSNAERLLALDELIEYCEPTQVRHVMSVIEPQFQRDFISLLPKELALYVLTFLEPKDLLRAAQTCRYWRILAEDNLLWREKCREEGIEETAVFGSKLRRKSSPTSPRSPWKSLYMRQHEIEQNWRTGATRLPKVLKGHDDHVITCLEFSGSRIVSGSDDNTLKVWSAITGKCLRTLVGHTGGVWSSQMCGHIIISGSTDRTLKVWNADTGQCIHTLYGHTSTVRCMHLHENKVVSGSRDATLRLWDIDTGECLHVLMGHVAAVRCVQYDGRRVVSGAYDYMVKIWDPDTETCIHTLQGHTNRVYSLQFDGTHIVSGSLDTSIRVWDVETGNCLHTLIGHQSLTSGMELKDNILVSGNADSTVKVWDITTGQCLQTLQGPNKHQSAVTCLQFNKKFVITSSDDGTVKIWDLKTGEFLRNLVELDSGGSGGVVWRVKSNNTKLVCAVGSRNGTEETKLLVLDFDIEETTKKAVT